MFCARCGKGVEDNARFCPYCGENIVVAQAQSGQKELKKAKSGKSSGLKLLLTLAAGILAGGIFVGVSGIFVTESEPRTVEGEGYDSPKEAALAYVEALKEGDVEKMISTFAVESYVANMDLEGWIEKAGGYSSTLQPGFWSIDDYTESVNILRRKNQLVNGIYYQYMMLSELGFEDEAFTYPISVQRMEAGEYEEFDSVEEFYDALMDPDWMEKLSEMEIGDVLTAEDLEDELGENFFSEHNKAYNERTFEILNADDYAMLAVEIELDGEEYYQCLNMICYDGKWYNCFFSGTIGQFFGTSPLGAGLAEQ